MDPDALKNALVKKGLDRVYGVRGGKIKLRKCCVRKRQREVSSCHGFIQRNSRSVAFKSSGFITDVEFLLLYEENMSDNLDFPYDEYPSLICRTRMKPSARSTLWWKSIMFHD